MADLDIDPNDSIAGTRTLSLASHDPADARARKGIAIGCGTLAILALVVGLLGNFLEWGARFVNNPGLAATSLTAALMVGLPYLFFVVWLDRNEREPLYLLGATFLWGGSLSIVVSGLVNTGVGGLTASITQDPQMGVTAMTTISAPIIEEFTKALALVGIFIVAPKHFDNVLDGIIYGAVAGLGFAIVENFGYYFRVATSPGMTTTAGALGGSYESILWMTWLRGILGGVGSHACYTAITGAGLGVARVMRKGALRWGIPVLALLLAMGLHAVWNAFGGSIMHAVAGDDLKRMFLIGAPVATALLQAPFAVLILVAVFVSLRHENALIRHYLKEESDRVVGDEEIDGLVPARRRTIRGLKLLGRGEFGEWWRQRRRDRMLVKLAFEKWHMEEEHNLGEEDVAHYHAARVMQLRQFLVKKDR